MISAARLHGLGLLHLRDQRQARVLAHGFHVIGRLHERQRHHVHADRLAVAEHVQVLLGHRRQRRDGTGDVQALARGDRAAHLDLDVDLAALASAPRPRAAAPSRPPGTGSSPSPPRRAGPPRRCSCGGRRPACSPSPQMNVSRSPGVSSTTSSRSGPIRSLGPGRSWRIATGRPGPAGGVAHAADRLRVLLERPVRVVQPRDVHARLDHAHERLRLARGGADRGDDLRAAHAAQGIGRRRRVCARPCGASIASPCSAPPDHCLASARGRGSCTSAAASSTATVLAVHDDGPPPGGARRGRARRSSSCSTPRPRGSCRARAPTGHAWSYPASRLPRAPSPVRGWVLR